MSKHINVINDDGSIELFVPFVQVTPPQSITVPLNTPIELVAAVTATSTTVNDLPA